MKLTAKRVARFLKRPGRYPDGDNLYLRVSSPGNASWLLRYERDGRERMCGLGPLHTVNLAEARIRAKAARQLLLDGIDPIDRKRQEKQQRALAAAKAMTFAQAAQSYFDQHEGKWRNRKHAAQFLSSLRAYAFPKIGALPVSEIDTGLVLKCIEPHWATTTETMSRVRGRIESVLDWATVRGYRTGDNPARWKGHLAEVLPPRDKIAKREHHPALPFTEIAQFVAALQQREGVATKALEFTILTAARTGEVIGAKWSEIDFTEKTWTIPEGRTKGGRQHRVPLSKRALEILSEVPHEDGNDHVFIGPAPGVGLGDSAMGALLKRMGHASITVHGFRSTFRDWAAECTNTPNHVVEMALAHAIGDKTEAAYRRGDLAKKRKVLMEAWAAYCAKVPLNNGDEVVVPMQRRAQR
jgi:integrase